MMQIIEQTYEEKLKMYMKQPKKKLAEMLIECNKHLDNKIRGPYFYELKPNDQIIPYA